MLARKHLILYSKSKLDPPWTTPSRHYFSLAVLSTEQNEEQLGINIQKSFYNSNPKPQKLSLLGVCNCFD